MIEIKTREGRNEMSLNGNITELCTDVLCIVQAIHSAVAEDSIGAAKFMEMIVRDNIGDCFEYENKEEDADDED